MEHLKVKDIALINPKSNIKMYEYINYIDTSSVYDGQLNNIQYLINDVPSRAQRELHINDILISSVRPNLKHNYFVKTDKRNIVGSSGFIQIRLIDKRYIPLYMYYYLTSERNIKKYDIIANFSQTTFPTFNKDVVENLEIPIISIVNQQHIVNTIGSIDDLIENYDKQLEKIKIILRDKYKSYDNLNKIKLGDVATIKTGKLNADACCQNGIYPFFTCSEKPLNINVYAFDGPSILLSGNGSQLGYLNFYDGKFNAYQRTYVIQSNKIYSIYASLLCNIDQIINQACGSAIPYITKPMIENLYIFEFDKITENIFKILIVKMQHINKEKSLLIKLKQTLLNKYFTNQ